MHYRPITDRDEKIAKLDLIVDYRRVKKSVSKTIDFLIGWLIDLPVHWAEITPDRLLTQHDVDRWVAKHGRWNHAGTDHNELGMAFAHYLSEQPSIKSIELGDSPDVYGYVYAPEHWVTPEPARLIGDIGQCSFSALHDGLNELRAHDMRISVGPQGRHVALEFGYHVGTWMANRAGAKFAPTYQYTDEDLHSLLYCKRCNNEVSSDEKQAMLAFLRS